MISPTQKAYALLWRDMEPKSPFVKEARQLLRRSLTPEEQNAAIAWSHENHPITESEILELAARAEPG